MTEHRFHTPGGLELRVDVPAGDVDVRTAEGEESVVLVEGDERLVEQTRVDLEGRTLVVSLRERQAFGIRFPIAALLRGSAGLRVRVSVPHGSGATVSTASADTRIEGRLASLRVTTASGDVTVAGEIEGGATVKTVSGDVRIDRVGGSLVCQTVSGDVHVGRVGGSVEAQSVSGDVRLESLRDGHVRFASVSGDVGVGVEEGSFLDVDAGSASGDLSSEVPLAAEPAPGGAQGPTIVLRGRTVSGDLRIFRARS